MLHRIVLPQSLHSHARKSIGDLTKGIHFTATSTSGHENQDRGQDPHLSHLSPSSSPSSTHGSLTTITLYSCQHNSLRVQSAITNCYPVQLIWYAWSARWLTDKQIDWVHLCIAMRRGSEGAKSVCSSVLYSDTNIWDFDGDGGLKGPTLPVVHLPMRVERGSQAVEFFWHAHVGLGRGRKRVPNSPVNARMGGDKCVCATSLSVLQKLWWKGICLHDHTRPYIFE